MEINKQDLLQIVDKVSAITPKSPTLPIIENILIDISANNISARSTDLKMTVSTSIEINEEPEAVSFCVNPFPLKEFLSIIDHDTLEMTVVNNTLHFEYGFGDVMDFPIEDAKEYPSDISIEKSNEEFVIKASVLRKAISEAKDFVANDDFRPAMEGINFTVDANYLSFAATDAHALLINTVELKNDIEKEIIFILPKYSFLILLKFKTSESDFLIKKNDTHLMLINGDDTITIRLIDGKFPNIKAVIPQSNQLIFTVNKAEMLKAIKVVNIGTDKTTRTVKMSFDNSKATLEGMDIDRGTKASRNINLIESDVDDSYVIGFNNRILQKIIESSTEDMDGNISIGMNGPSKAVVIGDITTKLLLLMPVMIS